MAAHKHVIVGVHIHDRLTQVPNIQKLFSTYGCNIKTRLGLHDANEDYCATTGLILLEMTGNLERIDELMEKLNSHDGIDVQKMEFTDD